MGFLLTVIAMFGIINPPATPYMMGERSRLNHEVRGEWVPLEDVAPVMARAVVAAEDADFCLHWGLDLGAIKAALADGGQRGGSTISQQTVKNVYLWQDRSWTRKAAEAVLTPAVELIWTKRRILEVYLNVIEYDEGVFGIDHASQHYFGVSARDLNPNQAARLAAVLPSPKRRNAADLDTALLRRVAQITDGAATIRVDGRSECFED